MSATHSFTCIVCQTHGVTATAAAMTRNLLEGRHEDDFGEEEPTKVAGITATVAETTRNLLEGRHEDDFGEEEPTKVAGG